MPSSSSNLLFCRFFIAGTNGHTREIFEISRAELRKCFTDVEVCDFPAVGGRDVLVWIPAMYKRRDIAALFYLFLPATLVLRSPGPFALDRAA
jgi:hypothetical protein